MVFRFASVVTGGVLFATALGLAAEQAKPSKADGLAQRKQPNFVFVLVDDLRWDALSCTGNRFLKTPQIDRIAQNGVRFDNAFVTTALCSPARGSFLTGMYAHSHGVRTNEGEDLDPKWPTFPSVLRKNGYETALVGKWHMGMNDNPRPGFDYWLSFPGQGVYVDPMLNENGRQFQAKGYMTDIITQYAVDFIKKPHDKPFCLYFSHKAVHADFIPAERHKDLLPDFTLPEPPNYKDDLSGKPEWQLEVRIRGGRLVKPKPDPMPKGYDLKDWEEEGRQERRLNYYRSLAAVDDSVGRVLDILKETGQLDNTVIVFTGDNGFFMGEHSGLVDKRWAYEESMRVPMLVAGPAIPKGKSLDPMVLNIDIAPTFLEMAGVAIPSTVQGRSMRPLLLGEQTQWRESFLYEYFREDWLPGVPDMVGVRTADFKYVEYPGTDSKAELYDLRKDPLEMHNLINDPAAQAQVAKMRAELKRLCKETGRG